MELRPITNNIARAISILLLLTSSVVLVALQIKPFGWIILLASALSLFFTDKKYARDILLLHISLSLLGIMPISTDISLPHMTTMGAMLALAVALPYLVSRNIYHANTIHFSWRGKRSWGKFEYFYIAFTAIAGYLLLPFYLLNSGAYLNWPLVDDVGAIFRLFLGTNGLGIWDELFFICTALPILRLYFPLKFANLFQAVMFTSFLFELGFTGWGPIIIFAFALLQGYIFAKTHSLLYVVAIHLTLDFVLFLALIYAYHPSWIPIFITG